MDFNLISNDLCYFNKETKYLMYEVEGNISLIKLIIVQKVREKTNDSFFNSNEIKKLNVFVAKDDETNFVDIWFDYNENKDLCFIARRKDLALNDVLKIETIVAKWLLSE